MQSEWRPLTTILIKPKLIFGYKWLYLVMKNYIFLVYNEMLFQNLSATHCATVEYNIYKFLQCDKYFAGYKAIVNDILFSATPPESEITPARILSLLSLLSHYFGFLNILT